jgi:hypothetical protein
VKTRGSFYTASVELTRSPRLAGTCGLILSINSMYELFIWSAGSIALTDQHAISTRSETADPKATL